MINRQILIPRRKNKNPNWLLRMARWAGKQRRMIINYQFYRDLKHSPREAWKKAQNTIS